MSRFLLVILLTALMACSQNKVENKKDTAVNSTNNFQEDSKDIEMRKKFTPMEAIKDLDAKIESYKTGPNLTESQIEENSRLKQKIIRGTFDISELSKRALDVHWDGLDQNQRDEFVSLMTNLLETKAIFSKEQIKGDNKPYNVTYKGESILEGDKTKAVVKSRIVVPTEKIDLDINYKLVQTENGWKIFDIIVDDASLVENYKFQFSTIINKNGYDDLIGRMKRKLAKIN